MVFGDLKQLTFLRRLKQLNLIVHLNWYYCVCGYAHIFQHNTWPKTGKQVGLKIWANMLVDPLKLDVFNPQSLMSHPTLMLIFWANFLHVFGSNKWFGLEVYIIL